MFTTQSDFQHKHFVTASMLPAITHGVLPFVSQDSYSFNRTVNQLLWHNPDYRQTHRKKSKSSKLGHCTSHTTGEYLPIHLPQ
jgi:hypothetical protein